MRENQDNSIFGKLQPQERAALMETVIAGANDGIIITEADLTSPGPTIVYVNQAFEDITGYSSKEVIGQSPRMLQGPNTDRETLKRLSQCLRNGEPFKAELLNYDKEGEEYWLDISIVPIINEVGEVVYFAAIERDITARKEAEAQRKKILTQLKRANLKAEASSRDLEESLELANAANVAKSDFLANMSHELRTPMNGVIGMAGLLAETSLTEEQKEYVSAITGSADTLLMLLNDILDFSKIEAGELTLEHIAYDVHGVIKQTVNLLKPMAQQQNIELITDIADDVPQYIWGDSSRMRQIITNLCSNAVKFTAEGYVRISATLDENSTIPMLHFRVQDTGIGIPEERLATIFEKFTQADNSVTRKYGGTGLGLAITSQLVELMEGEIGVESAPEKGSTFWFSVPFKEASEHELENSASGISRNTDASSFVPIHQAKALLVEDYPVNQVFAKKLLSKIGFPSIDLAENGREAYEKAKQQHYDIIFMDCQMPEMDGYEATRSIREHEQTTGTHTPIIAMTANAMLGDREKCLAAGMDDYVSKPIKRGRLENAIMRWVDPRPEAENGTKAKDQDSNNNTTADTTPPIDMEHLCLFTDGDPQEEKELFELFFEQSKMLIGELQNLCDGSDQDAWKSAAHKLKGSAANMGANPLLELCLQAELNCKKDAEMKQTMLRSITNEMERISDFFNR